MGRRRYHLPPPPDDAENIAGSGLELKDILATDPLPPTIELIPVGKPVEPIEFTPADDKAAVIRRRTVDEFYQLRDSRAFEGRKALLVEGELIELPRATPPHDIALTLAAYLFKSHFGDGHVVRTQMGMVFNMNTDPVPDLAVVPGDPRGMVATPATAELVLEVSDTTFAYDTQEKASLYAAAGIADYWVIDVPGRRVLVYRSPAADPTQKYGHGYAAVTVLLPGQALAPLAAPHAPVSAADLLP